MSTKWLGIFNLFARLLSLAFCSNCGMNLSDIWLANFRAIVDLEISKAKGKRSAAYKAMSEKIELIGPDFIYQIYTGKPAIKPKRPSVEVMQSVARTYANGRPLSWINEPAGIFTSKVVEPALQPESVNVTGLTGSATELALLFDMIPSTDRVRRTLAYNAASKAILDVLEPPKSNR